MRGSLRLCIGVSSLLGSRLHWLWVISLILNPKLNQNPKLHFASLRDGPKMVPCKREGDRKAGEPATLEKRVLADPKPAKGETAHPGAPQVLNGKEGQDGLHMLMGSREPKGSSRLNPSCVQIVHCKGNPRRQCKESAKSRRHSRDIPPPGVSRAIGSAASGPAEQPRSIW